MTPSDLARLDAQLDRLHLSHIKSHYQDLATKAAQKQISHLEYLAQLIEGEATVRENRAIERRIKKAQSPADPEPVSSGLHGPQHQHRLH